jgi:hypothetical protein
VKPCTSIFVGKRKNRGINFQENFSDTIRVFAVSDFEELQPGEVATVRDEFQLLSVKFEFARNDGTGPHKVDFRNANSLPPLRRLDDSGFCH